MLRTLFAFLVSLPVLTKGQDDAFTISLRGSDTYEGFIVTLTDEKYEGRICEYMWDDADASVACKELGLGNSGKAYVGSQNFGFGGWQGRILYHEFECNGDEENLRDCDYKSVIVEAQDCPGGLVAGLRCYKDYDLRLADDSDTAGRVEIYMDGNWTTVCDDGWGDEDAVVACRQFTGRYEQERAVAIGAAFYGEGKPTDVVGFTSFRCNGSESLLHECAYEKPDPTQCSHQRDAGVDCNGNQCSSQPCQNNGRCKVTNSGSRVCTCQEGYEGPVCEAVKESVNKPGSTASTNRLGIIIIITIVVCLATFFLFLLISYMIMKAVNRDVEKNVIVVIPTAPSMEDIEMDEEQDERYQEYDDDDDDEKFEETRSLSYHSEISDENRGNEYQINY